MWVNITAYKNLIIVVNPVLNEDGYPKDCNNQIKFGEPMDWSEKYFPGRGEGVESDKVYEWEESYCLSAGSYNYYNWWRNKLDELRKDDKWAFEELINFANNKGVIGNKVCEKLKEDFEIFKDEAEIYSKTFASGKDWFRAYLEWIKVLDFASCNGAIKFN